MSKLHTLILVFLTLLFSTLEAKESEALVAQKFKRIFVEKNKTIETDHFQVHYEENLERQAREIATICENLYSNYRYKYGLTLPNKTEVIVSDEYISNGWALAIQNTIGIWVHDFDWNLRGSPNWLENVVAHEYAHIVSISTSFKMPSWMPYIQAGSFQHANTQKKTELLYIYPSEILPPWFFEGIAQYESTMQHGDSWDSHRDMIFRQLVLNDKLQTWDQISVFNGRFDNYEKTYNHGFSLVKYISETYGYDKVIAICKESSRFGRLVFDNAIKRVLGISGRELYTEWSQHLKREYTTQLSQLGDTTVSQVINKNGYNNFWPKFSNNEKKIFFLSNEEKEHPRMFLYSYNLLDTVADSLSFREEVSAIHGFYALNPDSAEVLYTIPSAPINGKYFNRNGKKKWDMYTYPLPSDTVEKVKYRKSERTRLSEMANLLYAVYSPDGKQIASVHQEQARASLCISNADGSNLKPIYPNPLNDTLAIHSIYSLDWSNDGSKIALGYLDRNNRKIGWYDLTDSTMYTIEDTIADSRDPRFSSDSKNLYYSSNKEHYVFNIFRLNFATNTVEKVTNVVGGAFTPDISNDESRLLYSAYTADGYAIELQDSVYPLSSEIAKISIRSGYSPKTELVGGIPSKYSRFPRKAMIIPTIISEELLSKDDNAFEGVRSTKYGAIAGVMDPLFWTERGNQLLFFFLTESYFNQFSEIRKDKSASKRFATDMGVLGATQVFPFDLQLSWFTRNIPSTSKFVHNSYGYDTLEFTNYSIQPTMADLQISYPIGPIDLDYYTSLFRYKVQIDIGSGNELYLNYDPSVSYRNGLVASHSKEDFTRNHAISPHRFVAKAQYEYDIAKFVNPDEPIVVEDGRIKENYDNFKYHLIKGIIKNARSSYLNPKIDFEWGISGSYLIESVLNSAKFPGLYLPAVQVPGYAYYYQADSTRYLLHSDKSDFDKVDTVYIANDSIIAGGKAIIGINGSYRFPLFKGEIDKKIGFIYLDKLFGAVNGGGVCVANSGSALKEKSVDDWLFHAGAEVRLSTIAFNSYPLAVKFRWDNGLNRNSPVGGNRLTLGLGFEFDSWAIVASPDGLQDRFKPAYLKQ